MKKLPEEDARKTNISVGSSLSLTQNTMDRPIQRKRHFHARSLSLSDVTTELPRDICEPRKDCRPAG